MDALFRKLTLALCDGAPLEDALCASLHLLRAHVPVDRISLIAGAHGDGSLMRHIAECDESSGRRLRVMFSSAAGRAWAMEINSNEANLVDHPEAHPFFEALSTTIPNLANGSLLLAPLGIGHRAVGALALFSARQGAYTNAHAKLIGAVNEPFAIALEHWLQNERLLTQQQYLLEDRRALESEVFGDPEGPIIGERLGLRSVMEQLRRAALSVSPALFIGETGAGKDLLAASLHRRSVRAAGPLVKLDCAATPEHLIDAALFGQDSTHRGRVERAEGGTLILDEVGALPAAAQLRLLGFLQSGEVTRGEESLPVDVRVVAATQRDLRKMVAAGSFREDLWFRLNVFSIVIPPLRERPEDIPALVEFILKNLGRSLRKVVPALASGVLARLQAYTWPGNVRELENVLARALLLYESGPFQVEPGIKIHEEAPKEFAPPGKVTSVDSLDTAMAAHIREALYRTKGKVHGPGGAAELLGIKATTLRHRMDKLGISYLKKSS